MRYSSGTVSYGSLFAASTCTVTSQTTRQLFGVTRTAQYHSVPSQDFPRNFRKPLLVRSPTCQMNAAHFGGFGLHG